MASGYEVISQVFNIEKGCCRVPNLLLYSPADHFPCKAPHPTYTVTVLELIVDNYHDYHDKYIAVESPALYNETATNREYVSQSQTLLCGTVNAMSGKCDFSPNTLKLTRLTADLEFYIVTWRRKANGELEKVRSHDLNGLMMLRFVKV